MKSLLKRGLVKKLKPFAVRANWLASGCNAKVFFLQSLALLARHRIRSCEAILCERDMILGQLILGPFGPTI